MKLFEKWLLYLSRELYLQLMELTRRRGKIKSNEYSFPRLLNFSNLFICNYKPSSILKEHATIWKVLRKKKSV